MVVGMMVHVMMVMGSIEAHILLGQFLIGDTPYT
jgi:hypothetical protein